MGKLELREDIFRKLKMVSNQNYRTPELQIAYMLDNLAGSITLVNGNPVEPKPVEVPTVVPVSSKPSKKVQKTASVGRFDSHIGVVMMSMSHSDHDQCVTIPELVRHIKLNFKGLIDTTVMTKDSVSKSVSMLRNAYDAVERSGTVGGLAAYRLKMSGRLNAKALLNVARMSGRLSGEPLPLIPRRKS